MTRDVRDLMPAGCHRLTSILSVVSARSIDVDSLIGAQDSPVVRFIWKHLRISRRKCADSALREVHRRRIGRQQSRRRTDLHPPRGPWGSGFSTALGRQLSCHTQSDGSNHSACSILVRKPFSGLLGASRNGKGLLLLPEHPLMPLHRCRRLVGRLPGGIIYTRPVLTISSATLLSRYATS